MENGFVTTAEAAKRMKRSRRWVQDIILRGQLKAERVGSVYVIRLDDVENYRHQAPGRPTPDKRTKTLPQKRSQMKASLTQTNGLAKQAKNGQNHRRNTVRPG